MIVSVRLQLLVTVEIDGTNRSVEVRVREKAPVITVMFRAAQQAGCTLSTKSALFEVLESLKLCETILLLRTVPCFSTVVQE